MRKKNLFWMIALLCAVVQGAKAQANWEEVYALTKTTSANWTQISSGSTDGYVLGASGTTTYYYINENLSFTNNRTDNGGNGNSGLKIQGTVYLYIPSGKTLTCTGANADGRTGAGAGIELSSGNKLYILGGGTVNTMAPTAPISGRTSCNRTRTTTPTSTTCASVISSVSTARPSLTSVSTPSSSWQPRAATAATTPSLSPSSSAWARA